ncbi:MAG: iron-sulfur cluster assembly accessory protein [Opitutales bacterium]|nr:iron-sulfur cluster assembly accessory protein [Opitutales bacterium]|tara:strand:+ start:725 stop:1042 length:318 start_codon:yes stop_codon:yes gene_type:complete
MISFTEQAVSGIRSLEEDLSNKGKLLRISVEPGGCSGLEYGMSFDVPEKEDDVLESGGLRFLMDSTTLSHLDGSVVDFDDGLNGKGFEIRNPNAKSTCGCGKSFN